MKALRALFARRGFRRLVIGQGVSALGDWMGTIALMVLVLQVTNSSTAVGGVLVLRLLPAMIAAPLASRVSRRWSRRRVMLAMDAARVAFAVALPLVFTLWWIYLWAFLIEVAGLVFLPARDSAIPDLAGEDTDAALADGVMLGSSYATIPLGAALFGLVSFAAGTVGLGQHGRFLAVFAVDAATYLASFAAVKALPEVALDAAAAERTEAAGAATGGFFSAWRLPLVRAVMPATMTVAFGVGALFSVGVSYVEDVLQASSASFGVLVALFGVGAAAGLGLAQLVKDRRVASVRVGAIVLGAVIMLMSLAGNISLAYLGAAMFGAAAAATLVVGMSVIQDRLAGVERDLAFTAFHVVIRGGLAVAALLAGAASDLVSGVRWPLFGQLASAQVVLFGAGAVVVAGSALVRERRGPGRSEVRF